MRLTNVIRDSFVRSVMNDVPSIDYNEQAKKLFESGLDTFWISNIGTLDLRDKLVKHDAIPRRCYYLQDGLESTYGYGPNSYRWSESVPGLHKKLVELAKLKRAQDLKVGELEAKIRGVAYSVSTRKALADALPEFEKYLPADDAKAIRTLPVVQNVVADFVKAGWPKDRKGVAA